MKKSEQLKENLGGNRITVSGIGVKCKMIRWSLFQVIERLIKQRELKFDRNNFQMVYFNIKYVIDEVIFIGVNNIKLKIREKFEFFCMFSIVESLLFHFCRNSWHLILFYQVEKRIFSYWRFPKSHRCIKQININMTRQFCNKS